MYMQFITENLKSPIKLDMSIIPIYLILYHEKIIGQTYLNTLFLCFLIHCRMHSD